MKRIIRLTESDLTRIVRRVISEEETSGSLIGADVGAEVKKLIKGASMWNLWNRDEILEQLKRLKTQEDYNACKEVMNTSGTVYDYIVKNLNTSSSYDKSQSANVVNPFASWETGLTDEEFNESMWSILKKFNQ